LNENTVYHIVFHLQRIVVDSQHQSSTVSIEGLSNNADIGKLNKLCSGFGKVAVSCKWAFIVCWLI